MYIYICVCVCVCVYAYVCRVCLYIKPNNSIPTCIRDRLMHTAASFDMANFDVMASAIHIS